MKKGQKSFLEWLSGSLKSLVLGRAHNLSDPALFHKLSLIAIFAWIGLGVDAISSSAYGPQEAFISLANHPYLAFFVALLIALTVLVITTSYSQIVELFPNGGGGYLVAGKLLSPTLGAVSGCALLVDYVLTIAVSIASGADAIFSFLPQEWHYLKLVFAAACILALILINLRGTKESVISLLPIFAIFIGTHLFAIIYAIATRVGSIPQVVQSTATDLHGAVTSLGVFGILFIILRAYSMGSGTFTGIEAVSNGMPLLREPKVKTAKTVMTYMAVSLVVLVIGLISAFLLYGISPEAGKTLNAVLFERIAQNWGGVGHYFVLVALLAEAAILFVAAQTGLIGGPRVLANMALDKWVPSSFATLSDRLVTRKGVLLMGVAAMVTLLLTRGSVTFLVVLYSLSVFITFALSQAGMVRYWWSTRASFAGWKKKIMINGFGLMLTLSILISTVLIKFNQGGWITILVVGMLVLGVFYIKRQYDIANSRAKKLDYLISGALSPKSGCFLSICENEDRKKSFDPSKKTALVFVKGFNGLGIKALSDIFALFGQSFKNFVFIEIGVVEADVFKGKDMVGLLKRRAKSDVRRYVKLVRDFGYYGEGVTDIGTDVVDEVEKIIPSVLKRFPNSVFFAGQMIFPNDHFLSKMLHNYTVFALQERLYSKGIPFIMMPIKV